MEPVSRLFGYDRGTPVDRFYIERFLERNSDSIRGRVLEIGDDSYTRRFGGDRVTRRDVLHVHNGNPRATIVGDLASADTIPSETFDCAIITQTLQFLFDPLAGLRTLHRILRPGGTLLLTVPGLTVVSPEADEWSDLWLWSFTPASIRKSMEQAFQPGLWAVQVYGNVLAGVCALQGIALEDISAAELEPHDPAYPIIISVRAGKSTE
jgi:SAM-dependent methyltransferase